MSKMSLPWVPSGVSNHMQISWDMQTAFQGVKPLVNAITDDPNIFDEILDNIANDPNGPKLDIRRDVVPNLGNRLALISDHMLPISPDSERMLVAVEVKDEHQAAASLAASCQGQSFGSEPNMNPVSRLNSASL